jgi:hypothetical protein
VISPRKRAGLAQGKKRQDIDDRVALYPRSRKSLAAKSRDPGSPSWWRHIRHAVPATPRGELPAFRC